MSNSPAQLEIKDMINECLYFMRSFFFLSVLNSSEVLSKTTSIQSKLPTATCWSREKKRGNCGKRYQTPKTNHSQCSSSVGALNLIIESKSQPVELDNSTIELHVLLRRKKSLQSYCSVDFDFIALKRLDMTFDVRLHDDSSLVKLTNL